MAGSAFKDADAVAKVKRSFTPILLDGDDPATQPLMQKYGVGGFPTVVFADLDGREIEKVVGADEQGFWAAVDRLAK